MSGQDIDGALERLRNATQAVSSNLLELELDPHRRLLDESTLEGETQQRWTRATATLGELWQWYSLLDDQLERASGLRHGRGRFSGSRAAELHALLLEPTIELEERPVPIEERHLLGAASASLRCTPDELLERMAAAFDEIKGEIAAVGRAWDASLPRVRELRQAVERATDVARTVGDGEPPELERLRRRLSGLSQSLSRDPLSVSEREIDALEVSVLSLRRDLDQLAQTRQAMTELLEQGRALLVRLRAAVRDGAEAHQEVQLKIADPSVPDPLALDGGLERGLADVAELAQRGAWRDAQRALDQWTAGAHSQMQQAQTVAELNRAPIQTRNELRGRLDAYQAKAHRLGLAEDAELTALFVRARDALHTAPSDLGQAAALLGGYQQALARHASRARELRP